MHIVNYNSIAKNGDSFLVSGEEKNGKSGERSWWGQFAHWGGISSCIYLNPKFHFNIIRDILTWNKD